MRIPILTKRVQAAERAAITKTLKAVDQSLVETGTIEKSFLGPSAGASGGVVPGSPSARPGTSWSATSALSSRLSARLQQNLSGGFGQAPEQLEKALAEQGLTWGAPFAPGRPIDPFFGYQRPPRTFDYPVGANVQLTPRQNRTSYQTLKAIYDAYDVAQICVRHLINDVRSLDYNWEPIPGIKVDVADEIEQVIAFFDSPDKRQPFRTWLAEWLQDVLRYDAGSLYIRRNEAGDPIALEVIEGSSIIPLVDFFGRRPEDENDENVTPEGLFGGDVVPAYVQIIEGLPWVWLAADELLYIPWNPLPDSQYGLAPLEAVMLSANTDVRFQWHFLNFFTEGTMPAGFMEAPPDLSDPAQLVNWQENWDAIMQGDQTKLRQIRWVPAGAKFTEAKPAANKFDSEFPLYLMRRTCAAFGVTPNDLGFTENVNRATGDTQIDVQFRVGTSPLLRYCEDVINLFVKQHLKLRVRIRFDDGKETEDRVAAAQAAGIYLDHGVIGIDEVRAELGQPIDKTKPSPRYINNARSGPIPLLALESMAGKIDSDTLGVADSQPLVNTPYVSPPGVIPPQGSAEQKAAGETTARQANALRGATPDTGVTGEDDTEAVEEGAEEAAEEPTPAEKSETTGITVATGIQGVDLDDEDDEDDDDDAAAKAAQTALALRRWRENSRNRMRKGRPPKRFVDPNLSPELHKEIWTKLQRAQSREDVDAAFKATSTTKKGRPARPAFHHNADLIVAHYGPKIAAALGKLYSADAISAAVKAAEAAKTKAKKDELHEPPNLRFTTDDIVKCNNCEMFGAAGHNVPSTCWGYGNWPVEPDQVCDSWTRSVELEEIEKAAGPNPAAAAAMKSLEAASSDPKALEAVLRELYGDSFLQGAHDAAAAVKAPIVASLTDIAAQPDAEYWDAWAPGFGEAAAAAADGGMKDLLDNAGLTIQGMSETSIERIGNAIADGLEAGENYETTAKVVDETIKDASRSETIANTEYNRAMTTASVETYKDAGVEEVNWLAEADACPECEANAADSPYPLDGGEEPPAHPSCRCALAPVVNLEAPEDEATPEE